MNIKIKHSLSILLLFIIVGITNAQNAIIKGIVLNKTNEPIEGVNITSAEAGTTTNANGFYSISVASNQNVKVIYSHVSHKSVTATFKLKPNESIEFNPVMDLNVEQISTVVIKGNRRKDVEGIISIAPAVIRRIPGANAGVENILATLPGVNNTNELSTQYSVRGGNFDENLVYVNGIQVYRPFLIRSGQQEGLSFVNSDMVQNVDFSAGGFQTKYGDKLSSVLDITYKKPVELEVTANLSLLGARTSLATSSKDNKFTSITGLRYRDNSLFVNAKQTQTNFKPTFLDAQTYLSYQVNDKLEIGFLGNAAINSYDYQPQARKTNFGTLDNPTALVVDYEGQEQDRYQTLFGAIQASYDVSENLNLQLVTSTYHTAEEEHFDILANYGLGQVNSNIGDEKLGEVEFTQGIGSQLKHGRNDLDALISNFEHKGNYNKKNNQFQWSIKYTNEDIRDRLSEWEVIDSSGFSLIPPSIGNSNNQPYEPNSFPLESFQSHKARNNTSVDRIQAYLQWSNRSKIGEHDVWYNAGVRTHNWTVNDSKSESKSQTVTSPRFQFAIKPKWKRDMLFRIGTGLYYQPPFYRELRAQDGTVRPNVKAQKSFHLVLGNEYSLKLWDRPFKLTSEAYYKDITNVNPYSIENVRIRYEATNDTDAYAYGLDLRLNGEFVPGTESWFSFGYLKTEENRNGRGYIARPTDQRLKFAALFQDYVPNLPNFKMYLNLVYNTGVPGGSPNYSDPYVFQNRLPDYKRADIGFNFVVVDENKQFDQGWKKPFKSLTIGLEIFNVFDIQNSITNTWVRDVNSKRLYSIPNFLSPRVFNIRTNMRF